MTANGVVTAYAYDSDGWRIKKTSANTVTYYLRGLGGELLTEWTNPGPTGAVRDYVYADGRLLSAVVTTSAVDAGDVVSPIATAGASINLASVGQNGRLHTPWLFAACHHLFGVVANRLHSSDSRSTAPLV